jgi:hypothetical protein
VGFGDLMSIQIIAVYLSPHHDDVCFSLGGLIRKINGGILVNVFSISNYTDEALRLPSDFRLVSRIRDQEDDEFARRCGLTKHNLEQLDSPLRSREPYDQMHRLEEVMRLSPILSCCLAGITGVRARPLLFCPAGIGLHRDHLIVRDVIFREYKKFRAAFDIVFYEDLHYASQATVREKGLTDFLKAGEEWGYTKRYKFGVTADKLNLICHYRSQFRSLPTDLSSFSPADGSNSPHEAVWANGRIESLEDLSL